MKNAFLNTATAIALIAAPAAWAGSVAEPEMEPMVAPVVVAAAPYDWSGPYAGLSAGKSSGDLTLTFLQEGSDTGDLDGRSFGGFAGYNWQNGSLVYGLELALQDVDAEVEQEPAYHFNYAHDLKARLGYAYDNMLFYGFAGYTMGEFEVDGEGTWDADGPNFGLGVEMAFRENWLLGLEYIRRNLDGDFAPEEPDLSFDADLDTIQLRVGYKF